MQQHGVTHLLVPHNDEQNNEYLPANKERLAWLSGFTGSAGCALVTLETAVLFVDGRYTLQAQEQADTAHWEFASLIETPPHKWIEQNTGQGDIIGYDAWLHMPAQVKLFEKSIQKTGARLEVIPSNPVDEIWSDQPPTPLEPAAIHDFKFAGRITRDKLEEIQGTITSAGADYCVLSDPSSVCWLFNIRGKDVGHTPLTLSHAIVPDSGEPYLFIDQRKLDMETRAFLTQVASLEAPSELTEVLKRISRDKTVLCDGTQTPIAFNAIIEGSGGTVIDAKDPVSLPRAVKNEVEIQGSRDAHLRDGAATTTFLAWLDDQPAGSIDEITASQKLEETRRDMAGDMPLQDISFDTISGSGPNGAIVHYRVNHDTNRTLQEGELYLVDSGGQYTDGTTDITRTVAIGEAGIEERRAFTLVLKGHIAIALARFPKGTRGVDIDILARNALWQHGMDYAHGTGHGVGSYLAVHEGPQNISKRGMQEFLSGMIVSNEPGYYRSGAFGIRIENLVLVHDERPIDGGDQAMLGFETLTLAPIDYRLIDPNMLTDDELHWLNAYHGWVRRNLSPLVSDAAANWLEKATEPLVKNLPSASA